MYINSHKIIFLQILLPENKNILMKLLKKIMNNDLLKSITYERDLNLNKAQFR